MSAVLARTEASDALPGWRYLLGRMHLTVETADFAAALDLVNVVGAIAARHQHHPAIDLRGPLVHLAVGTAQAGGVTDRDVALAREVSALVEQRGLLGVPARLTELEVAVGALDIEAVRPFWQAVTGYEPDPGGALVDPARIGPNIWFQHMDAPRPQRNRLHVDVTVAHDEAEQRIAAALAAGGILVSDHAAPSFWVLADPEGNEACICTWLGRDEYDAAHAS